MNVITPVSFFSLVGAVAVQFDGKLDGGLWRFTSSTDCYVLQGEDPIAMPGNGATFAGARSPVLIDPGFGSRLSVVRHAADGEATITKLYERS